MDHPFRGQGPFILLPVPFFGGLFAGLALRSAWPAAAAFALVAALLLAVFRASPRAVAAAVMALCGALAGGAAPLTDPERVEPFLGGEVRCRATVLEMRPGDAAWTGIGEGAEIASLDGASSIRLDRLALHVRNPDGKTPFPAEFRGIGRLHPLRSRGLPGELPREWTAMAIGAQYLFACDASKAVFLPAGGEDRGFPGFFRRLRRRTGNWIARQAGSSDGALYLLALATGEVPPPGHPLVVLLRRTGLAHILAISGLNVSAFFALHAVALRFVLWLPRRRSGTPDLNRAAAFGSLPACWMYVFTAGAPVSAVRAAGMITVAVLLRYASGIRSAGFGWSALFFIAAVLAPFQVLSPSFLLSYGATFFLVAAFAGRGNDHPPPGMRRRAGRRARDAVIASTAAFAGTLPVAVAFFGALPAGAILWNVLFGPILGAAGVAAACLAVLGGAFSLDRLGPLVAALAEMLSRTLSLLSRLSGGGAGYLPLPPAGILAPLLFTGAGAAGCLLLRGRGREAWPAPVAAAVLFLAWIHLPYAALPDDRLAVAALNLGSGAAHVVSFPGGGHAVIDCGSGLRGDSGGRVVAPYLRSRGIRRIDLLVLTHPHEDHYGGAAALLTEFPVGEIWIPEGASPGDFGDAVAARPSSVRRVGPGDARESGGARLVVRGCPPGSTGPEGRSRGTGVDRSGGLAPDGESAGKEGGARPPRGGNEGGLLMEIRYGRLSVWLPGDAEGGPATWGDIPAKGNDIRVLVLPHHGSPGAGPEEWIRAARPDATVSQKPDSDCLAAENLLTSVQAFCLENGMLTIRSDGGGASFTQADRASVWGCLWRLESKGRAGRLSSPAVR